MSTPEPAWLNDDERATWITLIALVTALPGSLDAQMQRDAGMSYFEYTVLARLNEYEDRTARMSELAVFVNGSLSRLSHVARRLEARGHLTRRPLPSDGRITIATVTESGAEAVVAAAPHHVNHVRQIIFDHLPDGGGAHIRTALAGVLAELDPHAARMIAHHRGRIS